MDGNRLGRNLGFDWFPFRQHESTSKIFVSYRREDARGDAGRLTDKLKSHFGEKQIFRDVEAIEAGVDFVEAINNAVGSCAALLAIIGPTWLKVADEAGLRRLDDPHDFVRLEIDAALKRAIRVVPVLVGGAAMPKIGELPTELESFARRQAHELSDSRWEYDVQHLIETLEKLGVKPLVKPRADKSFWSKPKMAVAIGEVLLAIISFFYSQRRYSINQSNFGSVPQDLTPPEIFSKAGQLPMGSSETNLAEPVPNRTAPTVVHRPNLSYAGFDAIGRQSAIVQVYDPT
jgi:hypothetical protein